MQFRIALINSNQISYTIQLGNLLKLDERGQTSNTKTAHKFEACIKSGFD